MSINKDSDSVNKKGISLPINLIVILAIAILVMVVVAAFFVGVFGPSTAGISLDKSLSEACQKWRTLYACADTAKSEVKALYQAPSEASPTEHTVLDLCTKKGWLTGPGGVDECKRGCGCPGA